MTTNKIYIPSGQENLLEKPLVSGDSIQVLPEQPGFILVTDNLKGNVPLSSGDPPILLENSVGSIEPQLLEDSLKQTPLVPDRPRFATDRDAFNAEIIDNGKVPLSLGDLPILLENSVGSIEPQLLEDSLKQTPLVPDPPRFATNQDALNAEIIGNASGDYRIDALLSGTNWVDSTITYSFFETGSSYYGSETVSEVAEVTKANIRYILETIYEPLLNVNFVEVADSTSSYGTLRYMLSNGPSYAYAYYPSSDPLGGDVHLQTLYDYAGETNGFRNPAGYHGYMTLIHETGHALGLKHPGDYFNGGEPGPYLPYAEDNITNTVMSYNFAGNSSAMLMPYDILALQYLYGNKGTNSSNTTYTFTNVHQYADGTYNRGAANPMKLTISDRGGTDTINLSALAADASGYYIDLSSGGLLTTQSAFNASSYYAYNTSYGPYYTSTYGTRIDYGTLIENLTATSSNDYINGNQANNNISAGAGNDSVDGGDGKDKIYLGDGNDYLNISSLGNDTFYGGNGNDYIWGYTGNETYYGEAGNDTLLGYSGNDTIIGGAGADSLNGENGTDTLSYVGSSAAVNVNIGSNTASGGHATGDTILNFENLTGSSYNDTLTGSSGNNTIDGGNGNDRINLGDGNDYLNISSLGNDTFYGGNGNDYIWGYTGNETYYGEAGNDTLLGYSGNDTIIGGAGADSLNGENGTDTLSYVGSSAAVNVNIGSNTASGGHATGDTILNFENLTGSSYNDTLIGSSGNNTINGGAGNDSVDGGNGNDRINGEAGNDTLRGASGNDTLLGNDGNDMLVGGAGKDSLTGGNGTDKFVFSARSDSLLATYDVITGYTTGEQIDAPSNVIPTTLTASSGNAASLTAAAISAVLMSGVFTGNSAKAFTVTGQSGTFLAFNDGTAGFNASNDSILQLQGYTLGSVIIV